MKGRHIHLSLGGEHVGPSLYLEGGCQPGSHGVSCSLLDKTPVLSQPSSREGSGRVEHWPEGLSASYGQGSRGTHKRSNVGFGDRQTGSNPRSRLIALSLGFPGCNLEEIIPTSCTVVRIK